MSGDNNSEYKYVKCTFSFLILCIGAVFLIQSVAVVLDYQETQNFINNTCRGVSNFSIIHWNTFNNRAVTTTKSLDTGQNITLYYPPIDAFIIWLTSDAHKWFDDLTDQNNATFTCYIDYPRYTGINHHLEHIWMYYTIGAGMFILCAGSIIYCCQERTQSYRHGYYYLN